MPTPKKVLNAFTAQEVKKITGLSMPMIDYLLRIGYLKPSYGSGSRGRVRYYSYRDLVIARVVQRLRDGGVRISNLKMAMRRLATTDAWFEGGADRQSSPIDWLVTDGKKVLLKSHDGFLDEMNGQRSFAFVVNFKKVQVEVQRCIPQRKRKYFSMENHPQIFENSLKAKQRRQKA